MFALYYFYLINELNLIIYNLLHAYIYFLYIKINSNNKVQKYKVNLYNL
jgi:hypothetical protein